LKKIISQVGISVEFGGGVRKIETISKLLKLGVQRVILGTRAAKDKEFLKKARREFKDKVIVSIDAKQGMVSTQGWKDQSPKKALDFAKEIKELGFSQLIYTDIARDGTLSGPNIPEIKKMLKESGLNVIASGGISDLKDLVKLKKFEKQGLAAVIVGKALYEGKFTLLEALKLK